MGERERIGERESVRERERERERENLEWKDEWETRGDKRKCRSPEDEIWKGEEEREDVRE